MKSAKLTVIVGEMNAGKTLVSDGLIGELHKRGEDTIFHEQNWRNSERRVLKIMKTMKWDDKNMNVIYVCTVLPSQELLKYATYVIRCGKNPVK